MILFRLNQIRGKKLDIYLFSSVNGNKKGGDIDLYFILKDHFNLFEKKIKFFKYFYFYHLSKSKESEALWSFKGDLPDISKIYRDGNYNKIFGDKVIMQKSKFTNIIENLNSQMRDKISYLVRIS